MFMRQISSTMNLFQAIMKSYVATGSDTDKSFLAYMVPSPDEVDIALFYLRNMLYLK